MPAKTSTKRKSFMEQVLEGTGPTPPPAPTNASDPTPQTPEPRERAEVVPLRTASHASALDPAPGESVEAATAPVGERTAASHRNSGLDTSAWPRGEAPPHSATQQGRLQVRLTHTVAINVTETEQLISSRTSLSLNKIREIAIWWVLGNPDNAERFVHELLPAWLQARHEATERARTDPDA